MPGMLFVVCVPTADFEKQLLYGTAPAIQPSNELYPGRGGLQKGPAGENLIRLDALDPRDQRGRPLMARVNPAYRTTETEKHPAVAARVRPPIPAHGLGSSPVVEIVPMEHILDELLKKLSIQNAVWCNDKSGYYYQVFFSVGAGDPCENCLHCLTELGIGKKYNSIVSVVPCTVYFQGLEDDFEEEEKDPAEKKAWNNFVQSIRSKLTVKSVVDGVRSGAECSFDYLLLVLTADMVAAVGLVENNSVNIVAAMLISPLMSPIMAATFGTIIADRKLQKIGIRSEIIGLFISLLFGFIFGLLVGTTQDPWGMGDWPTEEMKGRGMARSLWIGILWALPSGTGVALALLQGSAGPLIGVAISASLLPPAVNCGIMWGLSCIVLIYDDIKIPHLKGENYTGPTAYKNVYTDWLPSELAIMGIISFCLTLVNICCIFISAITVFKIKEVAAPYTSSPDLRRFWEQDIRMARSTNRATMTHGMTRGKKELMQELGSIPPEELENTLEAAVREAVNDDTYRKVKRCSYSQSAADMLGMSSTRIFKTCCTTENVYHSERRNVWGNEELSGPMPTSSVISALIIDGGHEGLQVTHVLGIGGSGGGGAASGNNNGTGVSPLNDPAMLDQVIQALMDFQKQQTTGTGLNRFRQLSRSLRHGSTRSTGRGSARSSWLMSHINAHVQHDNQGPLQPNTSGNNAGLPTILESNNLLKKPAETRKLSLSDRALNIPSSQTMLQQLVVTPATPTEECSETTSLTKNAE